ncbi:MAG: PAS domain S-box protein, partial [Gammaproteobacteria bacterium]
MFHTLMAQTSGTVGQDFFRHLVRTLAVSLDAEYGFVTTRKLQDANRLVLVAGWHVNHAAGSGDELLLDGTPAARVLADGQLWHEDDTADVYPKDRWLRKHGVRAYCAVAIPGLDGRAVGHLGIMSRHPFQASDELFAALRTLAMRAASELRRCHLDEIQRLADAKFAASFRLAPSIIGVLELDDGQISDINQSVERLLGYSPTEITGRSAAALSLWENPQAYADILQELKAGGRIINRGIGLVTRSGEKRHGIFCASAVELDQRPQALFTVVDDSDYRVALAELHDKELAYRTLLDTDPNLILLYSIDKDGRPRGSFAEANDAACRLLGYPREELLRSTPSALSESKVWRSLGRKLLNERNVIFEVSLRRKDGMLLPCEVHSSLIMVDSRQSVLVLCRDLSGRKLQDTALQDVERKYRSIFENAIEGIYQSTSDGRVIGANPALARILGYETPEEMISGGLNIASRVYVRPEKRAELLRRIEGDGRYTDQEFQVFRRDGTTIWVCDNARGVRDTNGNMLYYEGTLQDITSRKRAEEALIRSEEKYRTLVDMSQDGVFLSQSGKYVYV